jgi:hypothetical protein
MTARTWIAARGRRLVAAALHAPTRADDTAGAVEFLRAPDRFAEQRLCLER